MWLRGIVGSIAGTLVLTLLTAAPTWANFEQVTIFPPSGEGSLYGAAEGGVAVDDASGDVYVADSSGQQVLRYDQHGDFLEAWGWGVANGENKLQTCGPAFKDGEAEYEHCLASGRAGLTTRGIAVDQATGNVYVTQVQPTDSTEPIVEEFTPTGEPVAHFGEIEREFNEPVSKSPDLIHAVVSGDVAVDEQDGYVYIIDHTNMVDETRIMVWRPKSPGDYSEYEYDGEVAHEYEDEHVAADSGGDLYVTTNEENTIYKFDSGDLTAPACEFKLAAKGISALAAGAGSNEAFVFSYKKGGTFYRVNPCAASANQVLESFSGSHEEKVGTKVAFNPDIALEVGRPDGVLYAVGPESATSEYKGLVFAQPPVAPPHVSSELASNIGITTAILSAKVDPEGYDTDYRFQYGTRPCSAAFCEEAPVGGANVGASTEYVTTTATIEGLLPGTRYYYRIVASNGYGDTVEGPERSFTTFSAGLPRLPDERAFELVSPVEKDGGDVFVNHGTEGEPGAFVSAYMPRQSASDGEAVVYEGTPFAATGEASVNDEYISTRTASGWQTHDLSPGRTTGGTGGFEAFSSDLSLGVFSEPASEETLAPDVPSGQGDLYLTGSSTNSFIPLLGESGEPTFQVASSSLSDVIYARNGNLYEWHTDNGRLLPINVLPDERNQSGAALGSGRELIVPAAEGQNEAPDFSNAVSEDGSRVFWSDEASGQVYMRENGERTLKLPDSEKFVTASASGSKVLLDDGYVYELNTEEESYEAIYSLSEGLGGFQGILGASEDLSTVYFVDTAVLTGSEENEYKNHAEVGADNLYYWNEGSVAFIATLATTDNSSVVGGSSGDWRASPTNRSAETSPNGRYLTFVSRLPLTDYDSELDSGEGCGQTNTNSNSNHCSEVFVYDSATGRLTCASCNPTGERPLGASTLSSISYSPPIDDYLAQPRYMLDDGRLFFESADSLSPYNNSEDVGVAYSLYEYEPTGLGTCRTASVGSGCVYLISSSGSEGSSSRFLASDTTGENVFFTTRSQLVPEDRDDLVDLYDARVHGGFPAVTSPQCSGAGCQGTPPMPPIFATPPSVTFAGIGNFPAPTSSSPSKPKAKPLTRAQKLAAALKACRDRSGKEKKQRAACETQARKRYGKAKSVRGKRSTHEKRG